MATKKKKYQEGSTVTQGAKPTLEQRHDPILGKVETQSGIDPTQTTTSLPSGTEMIHTPQAVQTNELMTSTGKLVGTSTPVTAAQGTVPTQITSPTAPTPGTYAATAVYNQVTDANAALGALSQNAQINSPQGTVSSQALSQAATGQATQATTPVRTLSTQELVESATLSDIGGYQSASDQTMSTPQEATVQYQLTQLMSQFDNGAIPAFASGAIQHANATMLARGLGASSMAGQAILHAAMETATAVAVQDAKTISQFNLQNLSNKQQTSLMNAQLRATLTGQELTNEQQTRVLNAAKVSEVNNLNFTAEQTVALENARLMQNMSLANLNNEQQSALQNAATLANMDVRNLDARLTAAVQNAKSFLDLDMANLTNDQQAKTLTYQSKIQSLLSDAAGQNAASQFNAKAQDQVDQFYKTLSTSIQTANANRVSAQEQFNVDQANSVRKFNTEMENERDKFDSEMNLLIDQSNVVWRRGINTTTNAEQNRVNQVNAQNLLDLTTSAQNQLWNRYRDEAAWLIQLQESREARAHQAALQAQQNNFSWDTYEKQSKDSMWWAIGGAIIDGIFS